MRIILIYEIKAINLFYCRSDHSRRGSLFICGKSWWQMNILNILNVDTNSRESLFSDYHCRRILQSFLQYMIHARNLMWHSIKYYFWIRIFGFNVNIILNGSVIVCAVVAVSCVRMHVMNCMNSSTNGENGQISWTIIVFMALSSLSLSISWW